MGVINTGTVANDGTGDTLRAGAELVNQAFIDYVAGTITPGSITTTMLDNNAVTDIKLRDSAALSVIGRSANSTGDPADIAAGTDGHLLRRSGTTLGFGTVPSTSVIYTTPVVASPSIRTVLSKLSDVADIRDWDAVDLTGTNDEASIIQAAIDETSGLTNVVPIRFPGCKIALGSTITTKNGTIFEGTVRAGGSYDTKPTWFHITHTGVGFTNQDNLGAQRFSRINTYRTQPTPGGGAFTPNANGFDFDWVGAQDIVMEDICLLNPTKAIQIRGRTTGNVSSGRIEMRGIVGQPLQEGIRATHCTDVIRADAVHFWPLWSSNANVITYTRGNGSGYILGRVDNAEFGRIFSWGYQRAMNIINQGASASLPTGTVNLFSCSMMGADNCGVGLLINAGADAADLTFGTLYAASDPASPSISTENLAWMASNNARLAVHRLYGQYTNGALLALDGTGNIATIGSSKSAHIDNDAGGTPEFSVASGNTLRLASAPEASAATPYGGTGTIETPDFRSFTPTITSGTGAITTIGANAGRYRRQGKSVKAHGRFVITTNGTGATDLRISNLPFTVGSTGSIDPVGTGRKDNTGPLLQTIASNGGTLLRIGLYDNTYPGSDGAVIDWNIEYEAA